MSNREGEYVEICIRVCMCGDGERTTCGGGGMCEGDSVKCVEEVMQESQEADVM